MAKNKVGIKDIAWSYANTIVSLGANLILLPFIIRFLDSDSLGLWYVFSSISAFSYIFDNTFAPSFARNIAYVWSGAKALLKEKAAYSNDNIVDWFLFKSIIVTCKAIYGVIAIFLMAFMGTVGTYYVRYITQNTTINYSLSWIIYLLSIVINVYFGYYIALLRGVGAVAIANRSQIVSKIIQIIVSILLLICGYGLVGVCIGYFVNGITYRLLGKYNFDRYKGITDSLSKVDKPVSINNIKSLFIIIWHSSWREAIVAVSIYVMGQVITVFSSIYLSLSETGIYSLGVQITTVIVQMASTISSVYIPEMQSEYVNRNMVRIREILSEIVFVYLILYFVGSVLVLSVGIPLLRIIKPTIMLSRLIMFMLLIGQFTFKFPYCYTAYFSASNRLFYYRSFSIAAILDVLFSYILLQFWGLGIWGLILAQISSQIVFNFWIWIIRANKELDLTIVKTIKIGKNQVKTKGQQYYKRLRGESI